MSPNNETNALDTLERTCPDYFRAGMERLLNDVLGSPEAVEHHQPEPKRREPTPTEVEQMEWRSGRQTFDDLF